LTLLDPFAGACSLSLYAKAQGLRVIAGDVAKRSHIVQQAFIENSIETLDGDDLAGLFTNRNGYHHFVSENLVPAHFPADFADFLDLAFANIADHPSEAKQALLKVLLYKAMLGPVIHHGITCLSIATDGGNIESLPSHNAKRIEPWWLTPPPVIARRLYRQINAAVFANGHVNEAHHADALDLVVEKAGQVDILYLDPPYPMVTGYEAYHVLDCVFAGRMLPRRRSAWSSPQFVYELTNLLEAAQSIPLWILSYGNVGVSLPFLTDLVEEFRPVTTLAVSYPHLQAIALQETADRNQEFILIAREHHA
jgi:hypothetical protein